MAIRPQDIKAEEQSAKRKKLRQSISMIETYFDQMLKLGHRDILLDSQFDDSLQIDLTSMIKEDRKLADGLKSLYLSAGWELTWEADYRYVSFKEL